MPARLDVPVAADDDSHSGRRPPNKENTIVACGHV